MFFTGSTDLESIADDAFESELDQTLKNKQPIYHDNPELYGIRRSNRSSKTEDDYMDSEYNSDSQEEIYVDEMDEDEEEEDFSDFDDDDFIQKKTKKKSAKTSRINSGKKYILLNAGYLQSESNYSK